MVAVAYLLAIMVYFAAAPGSLKEVPTGGDARALVLSFGTLRALPIIVFAYTCAQNIISIFNESKDPSIRSTMLVTSTSIGVSAVVYLVRDRQ